MKSASTRLRRIVIGAGVATLLASCAPTHTSGTPPTPVTSGIRASGVACAPASLPLVKAGQLTVATDSPAYPPWYKHNNPSNGQGFESAVAYAVAKQMGFQKSQLHWVVEPFNKSYAPGEKDFDFDINQISITPARAKVVTFSTGYYATTQAIIVLDSSKFAGVTTIAGLKDARLGAQIGTTSLEAAQDVIDPTTQVATYDSTSDARQALINGQIDGIVADLWTAFYISGAQIKNSQVAGQFQASPGHREEFGMLLQKGNTLVTCVDRAIATLKKDGTLRTLQHRWLGSRSTVPTLD